MEEHYPVNTKSKSNESNHTSNANGSTPCLCMIVELAHDQSSKVDPSHYDPQFTKPNISRLMTSKQRRG